MAVVDDAQWLDTATAEALLFAARRLAAEGVVMLFAARDDAFAATGLPELRLGRLPRADAERLLAARDLAPIVRDRIVREAAGNPSRCTSSPPPTRAGGTTRGRCPSPTASSARSRRRSAGSRRAPG